MKLRSLIFIIIVFFAGMLMCLLSEADKPFSIPVTMFIFSAAVILGLKTNISRFSFFTKAMVVIYALPFVHCFEYIFNQSIIYDASIWGLHSNPYNANLEIVKRMAMNGCIGLLGLLSGYLIYTIMNTGIGRHGSIRIEYTTLKLNIFILLSALCVILMALSAPSESLFLKGYTFSKSIIDKLGIRFSAMNFLSFGYAGLLFVDTLYEVNIRKRKIKYRIFATVILIVVIWFGFLRGDREWIGLLCGVLVLYILRGDAGSINNFWGQLKIKIEKVKFFRKRALLKCIIIFLIVFFASQILGSVRFKALPVAIREGRLKNVNFLSGTWSAVLLTSLSVTGDFYNGLMQPKMGRTYLDYLLSLPPGPVAQILDFERPIEKYRGPACDMRYGGGGIHVMVVPYMNFKSFGLFLVLLLYGLFIAYLEQKGSDDNAKSRFIYMCGFILGPFWFWYGDMVFIRMVMIFYIVWWTYRIFVKRIYYNK